MPELPEVETIKRAIKPYLIDNKIDDIIIRRDNSRYIFDKKALHSLKNYRIEKLDRRGKLLIIFLKYNSQKAAIFIHLGMSGQIRLIKPHDSSLNYAKHDHLIIKFIDKAEIRYNDTRRFGWVDIAFEEDIQTYPFFKKLGVEPLSHSFTPQHLEFILKKSKSHIKATLLNQKFIAGLGNIYVCEALYRSGVHPISQASMIRKKQISLLHQAIIDILNEAIASGGSSIKDYRAADGHLGYFQHQLAVYGKENKQCPQCKSSCIQKITQNGRSSFYCQNQQKIYKTS